MGKELGFSRIIIERDNKTIMKQLQKREVSNISVEVILGDCISLAMGYTEAKFSFSGRESNKVAHHIARKALNMEQPTRWQDKLPSWLASVVLCELQA